MTAHDWARRLAAGGPIGAPTALVVAHPDDETLFAGSALARLTDITVILVTDGAPEDMGDARRAGFATGQDYAAARAAEMQAALAVLAPHARLVSYRVPDQRTVERLGEVTRRLADDLAAMALVLTHPYEGGHPDHDAVACAVHRAAARLGAGAPAIVEFACYACFDGLREFGRFVPHPAAPEQVRPLDPADRDRLERALAAHATQAAVFGRWRPLAEHWRAAPAYDFAAPPPGETCLYDQFGWPLTSARWRALAG